MGQNIWSTRFLAETMASGTPYPATVPTGKRWILKHVSAYTAASTFELVISIAGVSAGAIVITKPAGQDLAGGTWNGFQVLYAGEVLEIFSSAAGGATCSGYELSD